MKKISVLLAGVIALASPASAVEFKPYGFVLATYLESWGRTNAADVPTQATSMGTTAAGNQTTSVLSARQSRVGLNLVGGKGPLDSDLSATIEADFFGLRNSGSAAGDINQVSPRLRLAYIQAKKGDDLVVFGQDWTKAFAPLNPTSLLHQGVPALSNSGNLWNRVAQLRWDHAFAFAGDFGVNTKAAIVRSFTADETARTTTAGGTTFAVPTSIDTAGSGEFSGGPGYQGLVELQQKLGGRTFVAGVSAQYVRETFNSALPPPAGALNRQVDGGLFAAHFDFPILDQLELSGEYFYGHGNQNLNGLGSVYNDVGTIRLSQVRGGWAQASIKPVADWSFNFMGGYEDVDQTGLAAASIYRDETMAVNAIWNCSKELALSLDFGRIHSYYVGALRGDSENAGLAAQYKF